MGQYKVQSPLRKRAVELDLSENCAEITRWRRKLEYFTIFLGAYHVKGDK